MDLHLFSDSCKQGSERAQTLCMSSLLVYFKCCTTKCVYIPGSGSGVNTFRELHVFACMTYVSDLFLLLSFLLEFLLFSSYPPLLQTATVACSRGIRLWVSVKHLENVCLYLNSYRNQVELN